MQDLGALLDRLETEGEDLPGRMREVVRLNQYAVAARYPGVDEPVEPDEYEEAVGLARYAVEWVRTAWRRNLRVRRGRDPTPDLATKRPFGP
jgi:HEPN domain-containing protein